jgi:transketolase
MSRNVELVNRLTRTAYLLRRDSIEMSFGAGCGHVGPGFSWADLCAVLFFHELRLDPERPTWQDRDRFILSKGHGCLPLYAALARRGYMPTEELTTFCQKDSCLGGHPDCLSLPGIEISTGSLGHGLAIGIGMALAARYDGAGYRVFTLMGDGELQEGTVWEAAIAASHFKLENLVAIVDYNKLQIDGPTNEVMSLEPLVEKWTSFGWHVWSIDGNDIASILDCFAEVTAYPDAEPRVIIANTVKGKGVSFIENQVGWHYRAPNQEEKEKALQEIDGVLAGLATT